VNKKKVHDVCLLLEGTYPFVPGGVSSWVHNLIRALPEISFTAVCILPTSKDEWKAVYDVPDNFTDLEMVYLHDYELDEKGKASRKEKREQIDLIRSLHKDMFTGDFSGFGDVLSSLHGHRGRSMTPHDMIYGKEAWNLVLEFNNPEENRESFIDYFWTYRFTHLPIFKVLNAAIPKARLYHSLSTGYAGLLGAAARQRERRPLLLTEHGIYTRERKIEIAQAEWIYVAGGERIKVQKDLGAFRKFWIKLFEALGRITYQEADRIITLYEGNRELEISEGADPEKTSIIPNGINVERYGRLRRVREERAGEQGGRYEVGFVGRVVPIKDVKTFIRACKIVSLHIPAVKFFIIGPTEEDESYYAECLDLVEVLGLKEIIEFTGKVDVTEYYSRVDLLVLTSISEAQPLVILEAGCAGVPTVASDVGSCRELLEGRTEEDRNLGPSGIVTRVSDPTKTAEAIVAVLSNDERRLTMARSAWQRVEAYYNEADLNRDYLGLYREYCDAADVETAVAEKV
jgi:polysaccharide biosynthesis protein PelF